MIILLETFSHLYINKKISTIKMKKKITYFLLFVTLSVYSQRNASPVLHEINNKEVVQSVYPNAEKVEKENEFWFRIIDISGQTIGYAMSSAPFCKEVIGYNNTTPVLIITDNKLVIRKVSILSHWETLGYVQKLEKKGFFALWNGKTIKEALKVEIDGYTGATLTAKAVEKNVKFLTENGIKKLPRKRK